MFRTADSLVVFYFDTW